MGVSAVQRIKNGVSAVLSDASARGEYSARLKWLVRGSGDLQAWSLEYRAGLQGKYLVDAHRSHLDETRTLSCPPDCATHAPLSHLYEARYVYELSDTIVNTITGAALLCNTPEPPFFIRESISWPFESILSHGLDIPEPKKAVVQHMGPSAIFPSARNYYHWLIEELPLLLRALEREPKLTVLVHEGGITERHRIVERELGIKIHSTTTTVRLADHFLPGRANDSWFIHPRDAELLVEFGSRLVRTTSESPERLYISRRNAARSLPGEVELEQQLTDLGFRVVHPESVSWIDQINLFRKAKVVVAPHGAGLSNLVFSEPGVQVIELTNGRHYNRCFEWLCHVARHSYLPIGADNGIYPTTARLRDAIVESIH